MLLLERQTDPLNSEQLHTQARAYKLLEQHQKAAAALRELLAKDPEKPSWRFELAEVLYAQGRLEEAQRALVIVLAQKPDHAGARELLLLVRHELERKR